VCADKAVIKVVCFEPQNTCHPRVHGDLREKLMKKKSYYVYILASSKNGTLYIGVTSDLIKRVAEHKSNLVDGFTKKYNIYNLVYFEEFADINNAILREKRLKKWERNWKIGLIEESNSDWLDLSLDFVL